MAEQIDLQSVLDENDGVVPQEICLKLLMQLKTTNESMSGLEDADLETLSEVMDFLPFGAGDPLITKGEAATWLGYIAMGGVDVIIGGKTVATMPAGKLLGGMGLFFAGTRTVDCGGGSNGGVIAAIRFDALEEMVTTTPEVAVRVYGAIAKGELQNLQSRLGETKKKDEGKKDGEKGGKGKKGKKRRGSVHAAAKAEVLYRSKAAAAAKERKKMKSKMDNMKSAEKKRKMQAKNEKLARKKLEKEVARLKALVDERDEDIEELNEEVDEMKEKMEEVDKVKAALSQAKREIAELKRRLKEAGGDITIVQGDAGDGRSSGRSAEELEKLLADALAELEKLKKSGAGSSGSTGDDSEELARLRAENERMQAQHKRDALARMKEMFSLKSAHDKQLDAMKALAGQHAEKSSEMEKLRAKIKAMEDLLKEQRQRLAAGGWTKARGEARQRALEHRLTEANSELLRMQEKCGVEGIKLDKCRQSLFRARNLTHEYFTSWLVECLARRKAVAKGAGDAKRLQDELDALRALLEGKIKQMEKNWADETAQLKEAHSQEITKLNTNHTKVLSSTKRDNEKKRLEEAERHATEASLLREANARLLEQVGELEAIKARLESLLRDRNATIERLESELAALRKALSDSQERCGALEATMASALTRRRNEVAICLQRIADITLLFLRVSQRCAQMDSAFGVLAPPGSQFSSSANINNISPGGGAKGVKIAGGTNGRSMTSSCTGIDTYLPDATPLAAAASFISSVVMPERGPHPPFSPPRRKPRNHFTSSSPNREKVASAAGYNNSPRMMPHPRDGSTVMLYREDGRGGTREHQRNQNSRDGEEGHPGMQSPRTAIRPFPVHTSPRSRRSPRHAHIKSKRQGLLRVGTKIRGPLWGDDTYEGFDPTVTGIGNGNFGDILQTAPIDPTTQSRTDNRDDSDSKDATAYPADPAADGTSNGLSDFKPDKGLRVESRNSSARKAVSNMSRPGSQRLQNTVAAGGSAIAPPRSSSSLTDSRFPGPGLAGTIKFSTSTMTSMKSTLPRHGFTAEAKESVVQFLMCMPGHSSQPQPVVRMRPLENPRRPGQLRLSGCLPLIHPAWHHIVIVDRDQNTLDMLAREVTKLGYTITALRSLEDAASVMIENLVDLVICRENFRSGQQMGQGPGALRIMVESRMSSQDVQRPIAPIVRSIDLTSMMTESQFDPEKFVGDADTVRTGAVEDDPAPAYQTKPSWIAAARLGQAFTVRMPVDTEPQRKKLAVTLARALGMVKMSGCAT